MSYTQNKAIARRFIQQIFNEGKIEEAKKFVTPDIIYHVVFEEVRGLEEFKEWIVEDRKAFPDMQVTIVDDFGEQNKVAIRWTLKASHEKFEAHGADIFHFETDKIKEAWTIFDALTPALQIGVVERVQVL
jgi:predicted SnoaL-like aldol condensation-catalyzing enzyme